MNKRYLITGAAGFIGYFLSKKLLEQGHTVFGIDNITDYYDTSLKTDRLRQLSSYKSFFFNNIDVADKHSLMEAFSESKPKVVINLAAQAGVRYSLVNPDAYIQSNIIGFFNILEMCKQFDIEHLVYASSSSVYGASEKVPFEESDFVDRPISLYAATKKSNELMAYTYSYQYGIPITGLRFFTVYGPMGRPDMAYFKFVDDYFAGRAIRIFNNGDSNNDLFRDFTYIDDVVEGINRISHITPSGTVKCDVYNIGNNNPVRLMDFIRILEKCLEKSLKRPVNFKKKHSEIDKCDVRYTYASTERLSNSIGFKPSTKLEDGLQKFTDWYVDYYQKK